MPQQRLWYAVEGVAFARHGATTYTAAHGVQTLGINTRFNLQQVFQLGQAEIYENVEREPEIEVNMEKVLDGYPLLYHLATAGALTGSLAGRANQRCMLGVSLYDDTQDSASGTPITQVQCSGMYVSQVTYDFPIDGPSKETLGLVGNDKVWGASLFTAPTFNNQDSPLALASSGGVNFREDVIIGEQAGAISKFPTCIEGVTASGTITMTNGVPSVYLQSARISANLGRQSIFALGKKGACYRYVQFPVKVDASIGVHSKQGDQVDAAEEATNLSDERIYIKMREGSAFDLGTKAKLMSCAFQAGNAQGGGGSNGTTEFSFEVWSSLTVSHPQDPSGL